MWSAHGEGNVHFPDAKIRAAILDRHLAPVRYVDDQGRETEVYPFNPNGAVFGSVRFRFDYCSVVVRLWFDPGSIVIRFR